MPKASLYFCDNCHTEDEAGQNKIFYVDLSCLRQLKKFKAKVLDSMSLHSTLGQNLHFGKANWKFYYLKPSKPDTLCNLWNFNFCFVQFEKEWQYWLKLCSKNTSMEGGIVYLYLCCSFQIFAQSQSLGQLLLTRDPLVEYDIRGRVCSILQGRPTDQQQKQRSRRHRTGCGNILLRWQSIERI